MQYQQLNAIQLNFILAIYKKFQGCIITILGNMTNIFWLLFSLKDYLLNVEAIDIRESQTCEGPEFKTN